jgi:GT2 family glycosyltransferase
MNWTFIICTDDPNQDRVDFSIKTIEELKIPNYEIIVSGGERISPFENKNVLWLSFDENVKKGWITKKKNDAVKKSKYDNICVLHDYFAFDFNWYHEWLKFNQQHGDWNIACNQIKLINGARAYTDWVSWDHPEFKRGTPLRYENWSNTQYQYVSGGYFCIKKSFFLENLFSEDLISHQMEDIEWSLRIRKTWKLVCNHKSIVRHIKWHRDMKLWRKAEDYHD